MSGSDVPNDDMPNFVRPRRRDQPQLSDAALAALLSGAGPPAEPAPGLQPVADVLAALRAAATSDELAGEAAALMEFRRDAQARDAQAPVPARRSRAGLFTSRLSARAAAAAIAAVLGLGGFATAAYAGVLPAPVQRFAHETIGAPEPARPTPGPAGTRLDRKRHQTGPGGRLHTAYALCTGYAHASEHGTAAQRLVAFRNLVRAAGGVDRVHAYCGAAAPPGQQRGQHEAHPPGQGKGHQGDGNGKGQGNGNGNGKGQGNGNGQGQGDGQGQGQGNGQGQGQGNGNGNGHHGKATVHSKNKAKGEAIGHSQGNQNALRAGRGTRHPLRPGAPQSFTRHRAVTPRPQLGRVEPPHRLEGWRWQAVRWAGRPA